MCALWESCSNGRCSGWQGRWKSGVRHSCFLWQEELGVSKSSHLPRLGPFLLSAKNPCAGAEGSPHLKLDPSSQTFTALVSPLPALGCAGRAEEP